MVRRRQPDRLVWVGNPLGLPVPEGEDRRRLAIDLSPGDRVRVGSTWRMALEVTHRTRSERTWVTVDWAGPIQARTLYHGADLVHVDDPAPLPVAPEELHMTYVDGIREWEP